MKAFASPASPTPPRNSETLKVFVGGGLDNVVGRNTQGLYKQYLDSCAGPAEYYTHLSVPSIVGAIRRANEDGIPVDLIGHSYGAMAAFNAANLAGQRGYHVRNLVTADPVGRLSTSEGPLPPGRVGRWVNISADPPDETLGERLNLSDVVALIGGKPSGIPTAYADADFSVRRHHQDLAGMVADAGIDALLRDDLDASEWNRQRTLQVTRAAGQAKTR